MGRMAYALLFALCVVVNGLLAACSASPAQPTAASTSLPTAVPATDTPVPTRVPASVSPTVQVAPTLAVGGSPVPATAVPPTAAPPTAADSPFNTVPPGVPPPPPTCQGRLATDPNLPQACKNWLGMANQGRPAQPGIPPSAPGANPVMPSAATARCDSPETKAAFPAPVKDPYPKLSPLSPGLLDAAIAPLGTRNPTNDPKFDLEFEAKPQAFLVPQAPQLFRTVLVHNRGEYVQLAFEAEITGPGGFSKNGMDLGKPPFPQPEMLYLQPGESQALFISAAWSELGLNPPYHAATVDYQVKFTVYPAGDRSRAQTALLANTVTLFENDRPPANATVSGCVFDAATKQPVANARVELYSPRLHGAETMTDKTGGFQLPVVAYDNATPGEKQEWNVQVSAPGYQDYYRALAPSPSDAATIAVPMTKASESAAYTITGKFDAGYNLNRGRSSKNGRYVALTPFHANPPPGANADEFERNAKLVFFGDGKLLWSFPLFHQTPAVDVSDDGTLVVATRAHNPDPQVSGIFVLDQKGQVVWNISEPVLTSAGGPGRTNIYEVRLSHNNRYLAAGDTDGRVWLFDLGNRSLVWQRFLNGQARAIEFDDDDATLFVGAGDGYLYALKSDGKPAWRTYVSGWPLGMDVSRNYILISPKTGNYLYLVDKTGKLVWAYPMKTSVDSVSIAPDESLFMASGTAGMVGTLVLDRSGTLQALREPGNANAIMADALHLVVVSQVPVENTANAKILDKNMHLLWSGKLETGRYMGPGGFANVSGDGTRIVLANGQWVYFLEGAITPAR